MFGRYARSMRLLARVALMLLVTLVVGACSDDSDSASSSPRTTVAGPNTGEGFGLPDACTLLESADVAAALGVAATPTPAIVSGTSVEGPRYRGCTWGAIADPAGILSAMVSKPSGAGNINYLEAQVDAVGGETQPVDVGENGRRVGRAFVPGGGGVGESVIFEVDGVTVLVAATRADAAKVEAAARAAAERVD
jgi:hypothetical protein